MFLCFFWPISGPASTKPLWEDWNNAGALSEEGQASSAAKPSWTCFFWMLYLHVTDIMAQLLAGFSNPERSKKSLLIQIVSIIELFMHQKVSMNNWIRWSCTEASYCKVLMWHICIRWILFPNVNVRLRIYLLHCDDTENLSRWSREHSCEEHRGAKWTFENPYGTIFQKMQFGILFHISAPRQCTCLPQNF